MEVTGVSVYGDCLYVEAEDNQGSYSISLTTALKVQVESIERYMCKANAEEFEAVISNLELEATRLRRRYKKWTEAGFGTREVKNK